MLGISIPGRDKLEIRNVVFDFNGTIAVDGKLVPSVTEKIRRLNSYLKVYVLTSDTYGTAENELAGMGVRVFVLKSDNVSREKWRIVRKLGAQSTICVGNGVNDIGMFGICALAILVIGEEGCSAKAAGKADIIVKNCDDALDLILNPKRIAATLRE